MSAAAPTDRLARVRTRLVEQGLDPTPSAVAAALRAEGGVLGDAEVLDVVTRLRREIVGVGPLEPLLRDPDITDVLVNGPTEVWVDRGSGLAREEVRLGDERAVRRLAQRLAAAAGRRLDDAAPYVDARLPDGTRLHAVLPPVAAAGTCMSLRVPRRIAFSLEDLLKSGSMEPTIARLVERIIGARLAFLVTGGTGTGKTTLLSTLLGLVDPSHRLLLVEDSGELLPDHPHVLRLEARPPNLEGAGAVTLRDLVRQALRMRPDRVVVGEVRGAEVVDLLAALNTGHEGGCGTLHANAVADVPARLEALASAAGMSREALHSQVAAGLDAVVHLARGRDGRRRVAEIGVFERSTSGFVAASTAWSVDDSGRCSPGPAAGSLERLLEQR